MIINRTKMEKLDCRNNLILYLHQNNVRKIIDCGRRQKPQQAQVGVNKPGGGVDTNKRTTTISWIPFDEMKRICIKI